MFRMKTVSLDMFFDTDRVKRAADSAARKNLSKAGAYVRTAAKSSIRQRKAISAPGRPPSSHTGLLRKLIFFGYDSGRKTVVVGPMRLNQKTGAAPQALEHGGPSTVVTGRRNRRRSRRIRVQARPYMGPALAKEAPKFEGLWASSIK
jgi:hypothetical protein